MMKDAIWRYATRFLHFAARWHFGGRRVLANP